MPFLSDDFCVYILKLPMSSLATSYHQSDNQTFYGVQLPHETPNPNESSTEETKTRVVCTILNTRADSYTFIEC